ncbi:hypothetical protein BDY19DRAFT_1060601 [Irpex rosettiformis]|uniref:Uncharacterized protein n=1 Tax=Irpex rosettiformis TaxID=378272 RepID=A0ACB8TPX1_9APHY|nr:hypothetical protein BDY19DRAFT_1060601 [Irpex rosettiformis]
MATAQHPSSRNLMSTRLGLFTSRLSPSRPGPSSPLSGAGEDQDEDWYIPYNGPYEPPKGTNESRESWGALLNGIITDTDPNGGAGRREERTSHAASAPETDRSRNRTISGASRLTSTEPGGSSRRTTMARKDHARPNAQPRAPTMSYIDPNQAGGVGESPKYIERTSSHPLPSSSTSSSRPSNANRNSLASIFTFGRKSLRVSASVDSLAAHQQRSQDQGRGRSSSHAGPPLPTTSSIQRAPIRPRASTTSRTQDRLSPEEEYYNSYYSTLLTTPGRDPTPPLSSEGGSMRSHPYAYPFPSADAASAPQSAPAVDKGKGRLIVPRITLLDPRGPKVPDYLKPSPRNSVLKVSMSTPNLRHLPKGKQKWLSAETWCDAIILPRPRFAMRLIDEHPGEGSRRIVSPPPSPLPSNFHPNPMTSLTQRPSIAVQKSLKKARSMGNISSSPPASREAHIQQRELPVVNTIAAPLPRPPPTQNQALLGNASSSRPYRPKSWALDDLALPSPMPSLTEVVKQGQQLENDRKAWRLQANRSFLDKRAGSISRSRSKSIGAGTKGRLRPRARSRSGERTTAFEALAERTLLGGQTRPPTIHIHGPPSTKSGSNGSHSRSFSQSQTQTQTQTGTAQSATFNSTRPGSRRTKSHAHSNSLGQTTYTSSKESKPGSHTRSHSLGKSAFRIAASAAALCGFTSPTGEKGALTPDIEKAEALEGAIQGPGTKHIHLRDQINAEAKRNGDLVQLASSPSAMLSMLDRNNVSPAPSGLSSSGEAVGIAITSPSVDQHTPQQHREPIRFAGHPYALNAAYVSAPSHAPHPSTSTTDSQQVSNEGVTTHRQPVLLHPYSQPTHPYAAAASTSTRPNNIRPPPPHLTLYAELTPDHVREFGPESLRYSPDIPTPVVVKPPPQIPPTRELSPTSPHPYTGPDSKRTSELGVTEALMNTLHRRGSIDSGLGASESEHFDPMQDSWETRSGRPSRPNSAMDDIIRIHEAPNDPRRVSPEARRPSLSHASSGGVASINNTTASSPLGHLNPPLFRRGASNTSSGSFPGAMSHESSPPLSPRVISNSDDLERFKDLFYRPERQRSQDSSQRPSIGSRQASGSIILDVGSQRSTRSGLSTLARQLSEELEELRHGYGSHEHDRDRDSQRSWGRRFGGLRGPQPDEEDEDPSNREVVLAQLSNSPEGMHPTESPVQMPIDITFVSPEGNIPEDVESSRASSILEMSPSNEEVIEHFRLGEVEAVSTPPIITSTARFSAELSLVGHDNNIEDNTLRVDVADDNHRLSGRSARLSPLSPYSPNTRSSFRTSGTDTSRMSGLSDFPAPPTLLPSRLHYTLPDLPSDRPRLERESSYATFGQNDDASSTIGQAL